MKNKAFFIIAFVSFFISNAQIVNIPDANFKAYLVGNTFINTNNDSEIQVSEATAYTDGIYVSNLNISNLAGIEAFTAIYQLICDNNQLTNIDVTQNVALTLLDCSFNQLTSLDVTNNNLLTVLNCQNNSLTSLSLNTSSATMSTLRCQNNLLTSLDMSHANWNQINCSNNQLISLKLGTGNMSNFEGFDSTNNNLTCIDVDDVGYSTATWTNIDNLVSFSLNCIACIVDVLDVNFKNYLVGNPLINVNGDGEIQCSEAYAFTGTINAASLNIANLKGIEAFVNLPILYCNNNDLTSVGLGSNVALIELYCSSNLLQDLDVSQNTSLTILNASSNQLNDIDVSTNIVLEEFWCRYNTISALNLSQNIALTFLEVRSNQLSNLDLTLNTNLEKLYCRDNQLTSLDVSVNISLTVLNAVNNQLTSLNVANGNNVNFTSFFATNNPNLTCIQVDDAAWSTTNWTSIDAAASFSENCDCIVTIPDVTFKSLLVDDVTINTNNDSEIQCSEAIAYTGSISVAYWSISDLTGIEAFTSLTGLYCNNNNLTSLDVSQNTALVFLNCSDNPIGVLDVTQNIKLETLNCSSNSLNVLNVSQNILLNDLDCNGNSLTALNVSQNTDLLILKCFDNQLTNIDLSLNKFLYELDCGSNSLSSLDLSQNTDLESLVCDNNSISTLDLSINTILEFLICTYNTPLTSLNVANGNNTNFSYFRTDNNTNLTCIQVDDAAWSTTNWTNIDATASFSTDCSTTLGIEEVSIQSVSVYPNPTTNLINIESYATINKIEMYDLLGKQVLSTKQNNQIDISHLPDGIYILKAYIENRTFIKKLILK